MEAATVLCAVILIALVQLQIVQMAGVIVPKQNTLRPMVQEGQRIKGDRLLYKEWFQNYNDLVQPELEVAYPSDRTSIDGTITMWRIINELDYFNVNIHTGGVGRSCVGLLVVAGDTNVLDFVFEVYGFN